jgi:hypothetical protein
MHRKWIGATAAEGESTTLHSQGATHKALVYFLQHRDLRFVLSKDRSGSEIRSHRGLDAPREQAAGTCTKENIVSYGDMHTIWSTGSGRVFDKHAAVRMACLYTEEQS